MQFRQWRKSRSQTKHKLNLKIFLISFSLFFSGCSSVNNTKATLETSSEKIPMDSTLRPGDVFEVRIFGEKELSNNYRVGADGTIDFPLIGTIEVSKLTPSEIAVLIEQNLINGQFLKTPEVSVFVEEYKSKKISVFGQVSKPGTFTYIDGMSIVEAISIAGGFTSMARDNKIRVTRIVDSKKKSFMVPVEAIGQGRAKNFILHPGDIVFVPERIF